MGRSSASWAVQEQQGHQQQRCKDAIYASTQEGTRASTPYYAQQVSCLNHPATASYFPASYFPAGPAELSCAVQSTQELSLLHVALTAAGVLLFLNAAGLSMSTAFRLTSGSLMFMSGAVVVLSFMLMR
jgi:hypothetical protein